MHSDRQRETLHRVEYPFLAEDHNFIRSHQLAQALSPSSRCGQMCTLAVLVTTTLIVLAGLGPNRLTSREIAAKKMPPAPRRSSAAPPAHEVTGPLGVPARQVIARRAVDESTTSVDLRPALATLFDNDRAAARSQRWHAPAAAA